MKKIAIIAAMLALTGCAIDPNTSPLYSRNTEHRVFDGEVTRVDTPEELNTAKEVIRKQCHADPAPFDQMVRVSDGHYFGFTGPYSAGASASGLDLHPGDIVHVEDNGNICDNYPRVTKVIKRGNGEFRVLGIKISGSRQ